MGRQRAQRGEFPSSRWPGGSSARYAFAFRGHTEYSIACFWDPAHAKALSAACDQVMTSLQRETP